MKIGLISTAVPHVPGGSRFIVDWLRDKLIDAGHDVEIIYIPSTEELDHILPQMAAFRMMKLDDYFDRVITFRPPAHMVKHPQKIVWFIHHIRMLYDLWDTEYNVIERNLSTTALREAVVEADTKALREAHRVFTNSGVVSERLFNYNGVTSEVLYPPISSPESFRSGAYGDEIVCVCRMEHHKRQHLLVEAMAMTQTPVRLRLCGASTDAGYVASLKQAASHLDSPDRIIFEDAWISEEDKIARLEVALAAAYVPFDEDSYGYPTIEAACAERCTITLTDAGGVPEFVVDEENGLVVQPTAESLAVAFDRLYEDRQLAQRLGLASRLRVTDLDISWDAVLKKLLS